MFRLSTRDLLWLTALAAIAVMWWMDRSRLKEFEAQTRMLEQAQAELRVDLLREKELRGGVILTPTPRPFPS